MHEHEAPSLHDRRHPPPSQEQLDPAAQVIQQLPPAQLHSPPSGQRT